MAIGSRLGRAYVSIEADLEKFGPGLAIRLRTELQPLLPEAKRVGKQIGEELVEGILNAIDRRVPTIRAHLAALIRSMQGAGRGLRIGVDLDQSSTRRATTQARQAGEEIAASATRATTTATRGFTGLFTRIGEGLQQSIGGFKMFASGSKGNAVVAVAALYAVYFAALAAAGAFNAIGRETLNLIKLSVALPAAVAIVAAIAGTLLVSMRGISDAWSAMGDNKKFEESLKNLSRSAANFMREIKAAQPWFKQMAKDVQEGMFRPLVGMVPAAVKEWGPTIKRGMTDVASEIGYLFRGVFEGLREPKTVEFLKNLFDTAAGIVRVIQDPLTHLGKSLRDAANAMLPIFKKLGEKGAGWIEKFATWLDKKIADGSLEKWMNDAIDTLKELKNLVSDTMGLLGTLFDDANKDGDSFIKEIDDMIKGFKEFAASPDGKLALEGIAAAAGLAGAALLAQVWIIWYLVAALGSLVGAVKRALEWLGILEKKKSGMGGAVGGATGTAIDIIKKRARGTITTGPEIAMIGEAGPEAVIPLGDPGRARELARKSGLTRMLTGSGARVTQVFYLGEQQIQARMVETVHAVNSAGIQAARYGGLAATGV